jgi:hypothetical protein
VVSRNVNTIMSVTLWGFHQNGNTSYNLNVLKFSKDNGLPVEFIDTQILHEELGTRNIYTLYRGLFSPNYYIEKVVIAGVTDATPYSWTENLGVIGTRAVDAGDRLPGYVNALFYHRAIDAPKRRGLGKMFLGGLYEQDTSGDFIVGNGSLDNAMIAWRAGLEFFTTGHAETNHTLVVLSDPDRTLPENVVVPPQRQAFGYEVQDVESSDQMHILGKRKWSRGM